MEQNIIWAPWRMKYIKQIDKGSDCFFCDYVNAPDDDAENFVLWRTEKCIVTFNRFPYNNGHLLIAPKRHVSDFSDADDQELLEIMKLVNAGQAALKKAVTPNGFNVGVNFGRCAGAGVPGHVHVHVVPRWDGDTNFMHVCSDTDVISQSMTELYDLLVNISSEEGLPGF